jgi:hypothetical protein
MLAVRTLNRVSVPRGGGSQWGCTPAGRKRAGMHWSRAPRR